MNYSPVSASLLDETLLKAEVLSAHSQLIPQNVTQCLGYGHCLSTLAIITRLEFTQIFICSH